MISLCAFGLLYVSLILFLIKIGFYTLNNIIWTVLRLSVSLIFQTRAWFQSLREIGEIPLNFIFPL